MSGPKLNFQNKDSFELTGSKLDFKDKKFFSTSGINSGESRVSFGNTRELRIIKAGFQKAKKLFKSLKIFNGKLANPESVVKKIDDYIDSQINLIIRGQNDDAINGLNTLDEFWSTLARHFISSKKYYLAADAYNELAGNYNLAAKAFIDTFENDIAAYMYKDAAIAYENALEALLHNNEKVSI